jgi:hypothetical protein
MTLEVRAEASRAARRALGFYLLGGGVIASVLIPLLVLAGSESTSGVAALVSFLVIGALVWIGAVALSMAIGFVASRAARRAAASLRRSEVGAAIDYARLAPENLIVALTAKPGELGIWIDDGEGLLALGHMTQIHTIALTAQSIWGFYYYALDIASAEGSVLVTLGTRSTWGAAEASRSAHLRFAARLLGEAGA